MDKLPGNDFGGTNHKESIRRNEKLVDEIMQMSQQRKGAGPKNQSSSMKRSGSKIEGNKGDPLQLDAGETLKKRDLKRLSKQMGNDLNTSSEDQ